MNLSIFNDRDLSWLSFNKRVLEETRFTDLSVFDRFKFIAIHSSNLEEFSRVRLAMLEQLATHTDEASRNYYQQILAAARIEVYHQSIASREILENRIIPEMEASHIMLYRKEEHLLEAHVEEVMHVFMSSVLSYLQPVILTPKTEVFLEDRMLYFLIHLNAGRRLEDLKIILNIPKNSLPRFYMLEKSNGHHYIIYLDDIIRVGIKKLFHEYTFYGIYSMKLNRDADLHMDGLKEEHMEEFIEELHKGLDVRKTGAPSRFQYDSVMPADLVAFCREKFGLESGEMLPVGRYLSTSDYFNFPVPPGLTVAQQPWPPLKHDTLQMYGNYFQSIAMRDYLLHFPYQSYDYVLVFFNNVVLDQNVTEIMATFYRVAEDSHIVNALISAAKNGKKVRAFVELKARFDEANNLYWAEQMAQAGVEITYSIPGIKVHAKAALIIRRENGVHKKYGFFGTGNFNEKTAAMYSDMGLLTTDERLCNELESVFNYLFHRIHPSAFQYLLVSQFGSLEKFMSLIDHEIAEARAGKPSGISIKINNLEDAAIIEKLYDASRAGVNINLMVRSICCLKPGIKGMSENIRLFRVVGRYLEHSRVFLFHHSGEQLVFLGSADWMSRNLRHRIEVVFPVLDENIKKEVIDFMNIQFMPAEKTQWLDEDLQTIPWQDNPSQYCVQKAFYDFLKNKQTICLQKH